MANRYRFDQRTPGEALRLREHRRAGVGVGGVRRAPRRAALRRSRAAPRQPRADGAACADGIDGMGRVRARILGRGARRLGRPGLRRVHERLRHREVAQRRQRLRLGDHLLDVRDPAPLPAPRPLLGHLRGTGAASRLHPGWQRAHHAVLVDAARVRRRPDRVGRQGGPAPGRRRHAGPHARRQPARPVHPGAPDAVRTTLRAPRARQARRDPAPRGTRGDRGHRRRVRGRQRPGDPRRVTRALHRVRLERVRDPRSAGDVLPAR